MFGSTIRDLPRFNNFQDACEYYNNTKGIRGRTYIRPLKTNRRDPDNYSIDAVVDKDGEILAVACWLYRTPVLVYKPDSITVNLYESRTTNNFINEISPYWLSAYMRGGQKLYVSAEGEFIGSRIEIAVDDKYMPVKGGVSGQYAIEKIVLNRKRAAESRSVCKGVVELARITSKVDGYWRALVDSKDESDDENLIWLRGWLRNAGYRCYEGYRGRYVHYSNGCHSKNSQEEVLPSLVKWLYNKQYDMDGCYDYEPAPYGVIPKNYRSV